MQLRHPDSGGGGGAGGSGIGSNMNIRCLRMATHNVMSIKHCFWMVLIIYLAAVLWSYGFMTKLHMESRDLPVSTTSITTTKKLHPTTKRMPPVELEKKTPHTDALSPSKLVSNQTATLLLAADNTNRVATTTAAAAAVEESIHVLILISSVTRKRETVCTTIQSVREHFVGDNPNNGTLQVHAPHILIHRYGDFPCDIKDYKNGDDKTNDRFVTLEQYQPHSHPNNQQQLIDYLHLMEHGMTMIAEQQQQQQQQQLQQTDQPPFSHVMFLDDDVELCPKFSNILIQAQKAFPSSFGMGHFGRGGSGMYFSANALPTLQTKMKQDLDKFRNDPRNVDASIMEWGLQQQSPPYTCVLRPVTIQMRHIGFTSSMNIVKEWKDSDQCGAPADNVNWRALSESASVNFFGEHCLIDTYSTSSSSSSMTTTSDATLCSPYTSINVGDCSTCKDGYMGSDCGLRLSDEAWLTRRKNVAPIVALLDDNNNNNNISEEAVLREASTKSGHNLINLYVLGNGNEDEQWLADNVYKSRKKASVAFQEDLQDMPRWGRLAFPRELITISNLLPPEDLWTMKFYERRSERPNGGLHHGVKKYVRRHDGGVLNNNRKVVHP